MEHYADSRVKLLEIIFSQERLRNSSIVFGVEGKRMDLIIIFSSFIRFAFKGQLSRGKMGERERKAQEDKR